MERLLNVEVVSMSWGELTSLERSGDPKGRLGQAADVQRVDGVGQANAATHKSTRMWSVRSPV